MNRRRSKYRRRVADPFPDSYRASRSPIMLAEFYDRTPSRYFSLRNFFHARSNCGRGEAGRQAGRQILDGAEETGFFRVEGIRRVIPEYTEITPGCDDFLSGIPPRLLHFPRRIFDSFRNGRWIFIYIYSFFFVEEEGLFFLSFSFLGFFPFFSFLLQKIVSSGRVIDRPRVEGYEKRFRG